MKLTVKGEFPEVGDMYLICIKREIPDSLVEGELQRSGVEATLSLLLIISKQEMVA